jgi:hypothetical protein
MLGISQLLAFFSSAAASTMSADTLAAPMIKPGPHVVKGVKPVMVHSHNDEGRAQPLWEALKAGCACIEPDIILDKGVIHVRALKLLGWWLTRARLDTTGTKLGRTRRSSRCTSSRCWICWRRCTRMARKACAFRRQIRQRVLDAHRRHRSIYPADPKFSLLLNLDFKFREEGFAHLLASEALLIHTQAIYPPS